MKILIFLKIIIINIQINYIIINNKIKLNLVKDFLLYIIMKIIVNQEDNSNKIIYNSNNNKKLINKINLQLNLINLMKILVIGQWQANYYYLLLLKLIIKDGQTIMENIIESFCKNIKFN